MCKCCQSFWETIYWHLIEKNFCYDENIALYSEPEIKNEKNEKNNNMFDNLAFYDSVSVIAGRAIVTIDPLPDKKPVIITKQPKITKKQSFLLHEKIKEYQLNRVEPEVKKNDRNSSQNEPETAQEKQNVQNEKEEILTKQPEIVTKQSIATKQSECVTKQSIDTKQPEIVIKPPENNELHSIVFKYDNDDVINVKNQEDDESEKLDKFNDVTTTTIKSEPSPTTRLRRKSPSLNDLRNEKIQQNYLSVTESNNGGRIRKKSLRERRMSKSLSLNFFETHRKELPVTRQSSVPKFYLETPPLDNNNHYALDSSILRSPSCTLTSPIKPNNYKFQFDLRSVVQMEMERSIKSKSMNNDRTPIDLQRQNSKLSKFRERLKPLKIRRHASTNNLPNVMNYI